jgi:hypothetical protein
MWTRRTLFAGAATSAALPTLAWGRARSPLRAAEVEAVRRFAETTHPRGRDAAADAGWRARWDALAVAAPALTDGAYLVEMRRALAWFADGHTTLLPFAFTGGVPEQLQAGEFGLTLPFRLGVFDDGLWVTAAAPEVAALQGTRLLAMNGRPVAEIMRRHAEAWCGSEVWAHNWAGSTLTSVGDLRGLDVLDGEPGAPLTIVTEGPGGTSEVVVRPGRGGPEPVALERARTEIQRWAETAGGTNYVRPIEEGRTLFICLDDMADIEGRSFIDLTREIIAAMAAPTVQRVVIDLRRNGGGNNNFGEPLRKHLERSRFNRPGGLYVMIGPQTFSAAQNLVTRLERETFALFAGGPTGGAPNHYGDAQVMTGEASGVTVMVSTLPWFDSAPKDERRWIMPDIPVATDFEDWKAGRDPVLAAVLADATTGEGDDVTLARTFPYRRPSQSAPWRTFWRDV